MSLLDPSSRPERPQRPTPRRMLWAVGGVTLLFVFCVVGLLVWANTEACENLIRRELISKIETATGGRVEIASFHWRPFQLEAETTGLVIHGKEGTDEAPYAHIGRVRVGISILGFISPRILLRDLEVSQPVLHLIIYADGSTNQPRPRHPSQSEKSGLEEFFDLRAEHVAVEDGVLDLESRSTNFDAQDRHIPLDFKANDVSTILTYVPGPGINSATYHVEAGARDLSVTRGDPAKANPDHAEGYAQASLDLTRNAAYLRSLRVTSQNKDGAEHTLSVSGVLEDFSRPRWEVKAQGDLDMRLLEPTTGYPNSPEGVARLDLEGQGRDGQFRIDGSVHVDNGSYIALGVNARGVGLDAHVHADPEQLLITSVVARLRQGGRLEGSVALDHWLPVMPGTPELQPARMTPPPRHWPFGRKHESPTAPPPAPAVSAAPLFVDGKVTAQLKDVTLDTVLDIVGERPFQRLGIGARLNGPATATWTKGDTNTLVIGATLGLTPSSSGAGTEQPATGMIDGTYTQHDGAVDLRGLDVSLPASRIQAHGHLGAYPLRSPSNIAIDFRSHDLGEFDTLLRDLGFHREGKFGAAALPATIAGQAEFNGIWTGSLIDPHLAGTLKASDVAIELPADSSESNTQPRSIRWDSIDAQGSYSAARIAIDRSRLAHGNATIDMAGTLTAALSQGRKGDGPAFDAGSALQLTLMAHNVEASDVAPYFEGSLPFSGPLTAQIAADGPIGHLAGSASIELDHGVVYGEPIARARAQGKIIDQQVQISSLSIDGQAGTISASGTFNLGSKRFQLSAQSVQLDLGKVHRLQQTGLEASGSLAFSLSGSGTMDDPRLEAQGRVTRLAIGDEPFGDLQISAHTANRTLIYDLSTAFQSASLSAHGETRLDADRSTSARLDFAQFNIEELLKGAHIAGLTGQSALAGTVTIEGPLAHPNQMHGDAQLREVAATVAGVNLASQGPVHAILSNGRVSLDPVHIVGDSTDLHVQGSLDFNANRRLDFAGGGSINLKLAETLDSDVTASGVTTFQVEAHGPLSNPGLRGRVDFQNASLALEDLPNSLSQLHGTLEFNQNRLEVRSLTAMTGGGQLSVSGYLAYQHGIFAGLTVTGKGIRIRYPEGVSSLADANLQLQGPQNNLLLSGNVMVTRFSVSPDLDIAALAAKAEKVQPVAAPDAPSNHVRLDVHIQSSPQLNFQNAYAKLAGDVDLRLRGTLATPSLLGRISVTEGNATIAGTRYELQRGDVTFTNPVRIEPAIDLNATARVEDYDITLGLHGSPSKMTVSYRSDPPLPEADVVALLALGRTSADQQIYGQQQQQTLANPTTEALLGGALNATVSSRVQKLFGAGAVKVDPNYLGVLGNSTTRITVEEQLSKYVTLTYATDVNTTAEQLLQAEIAINRHVSLLVARDESGVFSMVVKAVRRYR